jgi:hypothetical protein
MSTAVEDYWHNKSHKINERLEGNSKHITWKRNYTWVRSQDSDFVIVFRALFYEMIFATSSNKHVMMFVDTIPNIRQIIRGTYDDVEGAAKIVKEKGVLIVDVSENCTNDSVTCYFPPFGNQISIYRSDYKPPAAVSTPKVIWWFAHEPELLRNVLNINANVNNQSQESYKKWKNKENQNFNKLIEEYLIPIAFTQSTLFIYVTK